MGLRYRPLRADAAIGVSSRDATRTSMTASEPIDRRPSPSRSLGGDPPSLRRSARRRWRCIAIAAGPMSRSSRPRACCSGNVTASRSTKAALITCDSGDHRRSPRARQTLKSGPRTTRAAIVRRTPLLQHAKFDLDQVRRSHRHQPVFHIGPHLAREVKVKLATVAAIIALEGAP